MFGITHNQRTYWKDETRSVQISEKEMSQLVKDNKNFKKIKVQDFPSLFGTDGPAVKKAQTAPTEKLLAALGLLRTDTVKIRRELQKMISSRPSTMQTDKWDGTQPAKQQKRKDFKSSSQGATKEDVEKYAKLVEAIEQAIEKLFQIAEGNSAAAGEGDQGVAGAVARREQWRKECQICLKNDRTVRVMCGCSLCVDCYAKWVTKARVHCALIEQRECKLCPTCRSEAFQAIEVGKHVAFQPEWNVRYMPPIQKVDYQALLTGGIHGRSLTEEFVKNWNLCLIAFRRAVLRMVISPGIEAKQALEQAHEDCVSGSEVSNVMQAILDTHIAWQHCLLKDSTGLKDIRIAVQYQERAVTLFEEACSHVPDQEPADRLPDTLERYWGIAEGTLAMLIFRDDSIPRLERFRCALEHHEKSRIIFSRAHFPMGEANAYGNIAVMNYCIGAENAKEKDEENAEEKEQVMQDIEDACKAYDGQIKMYSDINADHPEPPLIAREQKDAVKLNLFCLYTILGRKDSAQAALGFDDPSEDANGVLISLLKLVEQWGHNPLVGQMADEQVAEAYVQPTGAHAHNQEPSIQILGDVTANGTISEEEAVDLAMDTLNVNLGLDIVQFVSEP